MTPEGFDFPTRCDDDSIDDRGTRFELDRDLPDRREMLDDMIKSDRILHDVGTDAWITLRDGLTLRDQITLRMVPLRWGRHEVEEKIAQFYRVYSVLGLWKEKESLLRCPDAQMLRWCGIMRGRMGV